MAVLLSLFFSLSLHVTPLWADATVPTSEVLAATKLLQEKNYTTAFAAFEGLFKSGEESSAHLYNWGLAAYYLEQKGLATGLWRRALYLDPDLLSAKQALQFISQELPQEFGASSIGYWDLLKSKILIHLSLNKFLVILWLFLVPSGFLLIRYWGARGRALRENTPLPPPPYMGVSFLIAFVVTLILSLSKAISLFEVRATVVKSQTTLRTGPSDQDNSIFDLVEGSDVHVRQAQSDWVLITISSGMSGWVPTSSLFQHTGKKRLW